MAKWKLCRQTYGDDIYEFTEGDEVTIGRGIQNSIILSSLNISRKHCVINVKKDEVIIVDLKSANGIFVGLKKIPPNIPFSLSNNDIIGLGWVDGAPLAQVNDAEKFVFKLLKIQNDSITDRIQFQNENVPHITPDEILQHSINLQQPVISKLSLKRKSNSGSSNNDESNQNDSKIKHSSVNHNENSNDPFVKKFKHSFMYEDSNVNPIIKMENEDEQLEAFNIKQECFDDEVQVIDSDSDSEQWYIRLSQNSPGKPFSSFSEARKSEECHQQDSSYSQLDEDVIIVKNEVKKDDELDEEIYEDDLFTMLPQPLNIFNVASTLSTETTHKNNSTAESIKTNSKISNKNNSSSHILNVPMDIIDGISIKKTADTDHKIKCSNEENLVPEPINTFNDSVEKKIYLKSSPINMINKTVENDERSNISKCSNESNKKHKETKHTIICEVQSNKSHKSKRKQLTEDKSPANKRFSFDNKGKLKKKYDLKKSKSSTKTNAQSEVLKQKLRDIATKDKGEGEFSGNSNLLTNENCNVTSSKVNAKVTTSNRGAFLVEQLINKPSNKRKAVKDNRDTKKGVNDCKDLENINKMKNRELNESKDQTELIDKCKKDQTKSVQKKHRTVSVESPASTDIVSVASRRRQSHNIYKEGDEKNHSESKSRDKSDNMQCKNHIQKPNSSNCQLKQNESIIEKSGTNEKKISLDDSTTTSNKKESSADTRLQCKNQVSENNAASKPSRKTILKDMNENKDPNRKSGKRVTFAETHPQILEFEIEEGNQMKKTSTAKSTLLPTHNNMPVFSLQKFALITILRWNPHWLEEQNNFNEPPPILGHNNVPTAVLHTFNDHAQYVNLIGDLLFMEIWECLTQGHIKKRSDNTFLPMRIEYLPLVPPQRHGPELISLNVDASVPKAHVHMIPREGDIMVVLFGEEINHCRFFFVHSVRCLPSPPNNVNSFYSISLQTSFTEKMRTLQRGAKMYGKILAYINKDLRLFEAMEHLARSPLSGLILNPQPSDFILDESDRSCSVNSQWSQTLNDSQRTAVMCAVSAARGQRPRVHMIQGPPGTGKSRVICAIVMEYFYDAAGKKQKNRGKILICATSNAAVDELVIRLLDIRQSLPQPERLKVVRVGREEAMHARARDISSLRLAQRDLSRLQPAPAPPPAALSALSAEISLLEAKKNMWQTKAMSATDEPRKAYCQNRVVEITKKIAMFRNGVGGGAVGGGCAPEHVAQVERRVLQGADVVLTTLASAHSHKMRGLAGRIALCVVDEAGQAIEPETLVPLTLGVTRLVLVGDPQQLPGFICSQRAKQHGLGESLFSRLSSCAEAWPEGGPVLLDRQYRMHPHIADYPNRAFYEGRVRNEPAPPLALDTAPYFVLGILSGDNGQDASGANDAEGWGAARVALALRSRLRAAAPHAAHSLAVITPYAAQRDLVRRHLRTLQQAEGGDDEAEVEVNTVDSFQGQERAVVVVSLARSHGLGFLAAAGRMNVMLTRAKHALVLCLNPQALENNPQWRTLVEDAQKRNLFGILPMTMCRPPSIQQVTSQEILQYLSNPPPGNNARNLPLQPFRRRPNNKQRRRNRRGRH